MQWKWTDSPWTEYKRGIFIFVNLKLYDNVQSVGRVSDNFIMKAFENWLELPENQWELSCDSMQMSLILTLLCIFHIPNWMLFKCYSNLYQNHINNFMLLLKTITPLPYHSNWLFNGKYIFWFNVFYWYQSEYFSSSFCKTSSSEIILIIELFWSKSSSLVKVL